MLGAVIEPIWGSHHFPIGRCDHTFSPICKTAHYFRCCSRYILGGFSLDTVRIPLSIFDKPLYRRTSWTQADDQESCPRGVNVCCCNIFCDLASMRPIKLFLPMELLAPRFKLIKDKNSLFGHRLRYPLIVKPWREDGSNNASEY